MNSINILTVFLFAYFVHAKVGIPNPFEGTINNFPSGCSPNHGLYNRGLTMELYNYSYIHPQSIQSYFNTSTLKKMEKGQCWDPSYLDVNYPRTGYKTHNRFAKVNGIDGILDFEFNPTRSCVPSKGQLPQNYNYPLQFTLSNFTMLLYGYFKPKVTAKHTFTIFADDLLFLNFGAGNAFDCCQQQDTIDDFGNYQAYALWGSDTQQNTLTVNLDANIYYPIRMFYNNRDFKGALNMYFTTDESNTKINDFSGYLFNIPDSSEGCPAHISYETECGNVSGAITYSTEYITESIESPNIPVTSTIFHIQVPCPSSSTSIYCSDGFYDPIANSCVKTESSEIIVATASTTYTPGPVTDTTTISTYVTHITGSDNRDTPETVFVVETPEDPQSPSNSHIPSSSVSSSSVWPSSISVTEIPSSSVSTIETSNITYSQTLSTSPSTFASSNIVPSPSQSYISPGDSSISSSSSFYSNSSSTDIPLTNPSSTASSVSTFNTIIPTASTTYVPGSVSTITTISTYTTYITGPDNRETPETVFVVETPQDPESSSSFFTSTIITPTASTTYVPGSVSTITTISTYTTYITGPDNRETPETVFVVETPQDPESSSSFFTSTIITPTASTTYVPGSVSTITTISTYTTYITGPDNRETPETVFVVETPQDPESSSSFFTSTIITPTASTTYVPGSVSTITTISTYTTYITGPDNRETPETVFVVETPKFSEYRTLNSRTTRTRTTRTLVPQTDTTSSNIVTLQTEHSRPETVIIHLDTSFYSDVLTSHSHSNYRNFATKNTDITPCSSFDTSPQNARKTEESGEMYTTVKSISFSSAISSEPIEYQLQASSITLLPVSSTYLIILTIIMTAICLI
ncbi:hypothetical protein J7297_02534 [Nakaseomyces glabratus]|nr:hypothetical protein J7296_03900 [Nakaseomyces glabratus]KAH7587260.1 hypothetical protein J7297_02534 [Nakaseomyces glabratus]